MLEIFVNTAREPKHNDGTDQEAADRRRGMKLINGRSPSSRTFRIAIANDLFASKPHLEMDGAAPKNSFAADGFASKARELQKEHTPTRRNRSDGVKALGFALTVAATGVVLKYLLGDRRK
jgi:hypothetical protein